MDCEGEVLQAPASAVLGGVLDLVWFSIIQVPREGPSHLKGTIKEAAAQKKVESRTSLPLTVAVILPAQHAALTQHQLPLWVEQSITYHVHKVAKACCLLLTL
jgi:hypothetical protein